MRVVIADDEPLARERLRMLLSGQADVQIVAEAGDGREALHACADHAPDVVLLDIAMPGMDGIEAAMLIRRHNPNARIVFVTVHAESMLIEAGREAGALGYVLKDAAGEDLVAAIRAALSGRQYVSRELRGDEEP